MGTTVTTVTTRQSQTTVCSQYLSKTTPVTSETTTALSTATWTRTSVTFHRHALPSDQHRSQVINQLQQVTHTPSAQLQPRATSHVAQQLHQQSAQLSWEPLQHQQTHTTATTQYSATVTTLPRHSWTTQATSPRTTA